ncbi:MAG TPA: DUF2065 domain-containing protein [Gammaproteobacteria bacterium]|nr:DUF2065 domain-containing protein [Gammaproteobacteria bacterium]
MWQDLGAAIALVLVIEGVMPFASPATWRRAMRSVLEMDDRTLRVAGLTSMALGLLLLYLVRQ